jgi:4-hydroxyphenylpyruvate dioxygenase
MTASLARESVTESPNPLGLDGLEFIEFATRQPQALGLVLERMGFRPVARHRSREVMLYRQGAMNLIINANPDDALGVDDGPVISAFALRVRDAGAAYRMAIERGAWDVPMQAGPMELNIPAVRGPGGSRIYLVDRAKEFSIYDVDFTLIPTVDAHPAAVADLRYFGIVQYIGRDRSYDWIEFYRELFGFEELSEAERFGILPKGTVLRSPCRSFFLQLIEPDPVTIAYDEQEMLRRIAFGAPDVPGAVAQLRARGVEFVESDKVHTEARGALTRSVLGSVSFELVHIEG